MSDGSTITVNGKSFKAAVCPECGIKIYPESEMKYHRMIRNAIKDRHMSTLKELQYIFRNMRNLKHPL